MKNLKFIDDPERRKFLSWAAASLAFLSALGVSRPNRSAAPLNPPQRLKAGLEVVLGDRQAAREIGRRYFAEHPEENNLEILAGDLMDASWDGNVESLQRRIQELRVRDFANDDLVIMHGWVLARIEARICALMCIL